MGDEIDVRLVQDLSTLQCILRKVVLLLSGNNNESEVESAEMVGVENVPRQHEKGNNEHEKGSRPHSKKL